MSAVFEAIEDVFEAVGDVVGDVVEGVFDIVETVMEEVVEPVMNTVTKVIEAAAEDPIGTMIKVGTAIVAPQLLPLVSAADTLAKGGDLDDALKSAAVSYVAQGVGQYAGGLGDQVGAALEYGTDLGSQQTAMLAAQNAGLGSLGDLTGNVIGSTAAGIVRGQDPLDALLAGGISAGTSAVTREIDGFTELPQSVQRSVNAAVSTTLMGGDPSNALISAALNAGIAEARSSGQDVSAQAPEQPADGGITNRVYDPITGMPVEGITPPDATEVQPAENALPVELQTEAGLPSVAPAEQAPQPEAGLPSVVPSDQATQPEAAQAPVLPSDQAPQAEDKTASVAPVDQEIKEEGGLPSVAPENQTLQPEGGLPSVIPDIKTTLPAESETAPLKDNGDGTFSEKLSDGSEIIRDENGNYIGYKSAIQSEFEESASTTPADTTSDDATPAEKTQDEMTPQDWAALYATPTTNPDTGETIVGANPDDYPNQNFGADVEMPEDFTGEGPAIWKENEDGTKTMTSDDGSTITINEDGEVTNVTQATDTPYTGGTSSPSNPNVSIDSLISSLIPYAGIGLGGAAIFGGSRPGSGGQSGGAGSQADQDAARRQIGMNWNQQGVNSLVNGAAYGQRFFDPKFEEVPAAKGGLMSLAAGGPTGAPYNLGSYSDGGRMLRGPGDGMSDHIPATIAGKQPARLADGEFVIPADVVSHLGNGSSDAGSKVLYKMMEKVRKARTGNAKQGKKINPNKFVPR